MLKMYMLGNLQFKSSDDDVIDPKLRRKTRAILAYLCLVQKPLKRDYLYDLFCSESADPAGNLRWHISRLRRTLDKDILLTHDKTVQINSDNIWVDAKAFEHLLIQEGRQDIEETLMLYRGELLSGLSLPDVSEYDFWLLGQRAHYERLFERHALVLIEQLIQKMAYSKALDWARKLLDHNPTLEDIHYWLMWLYAQLGQTDYAEQQFVTYAQLMLQEFGAKPSDRIVRLHQQIKRDELPEIVQKNAISLTPNLAYDTHLFLGREQECIQLENLWQKAQAGQGTLLVVSADAGLGKSALVAQFVTSVHHQQATHAFYGTCYESTLNSALAPWIKIVRTYFDYLTSQTSIVIPDIIRNRLNFILPDLLNAESDDLTHADTNALDADLLLNTIVDFFCLLSQQQAFIIVLEDIHFADDLSIQLLTLILNRLHDTGILILATQRPIEAQDNQALQTALGDWQVTNQYHSIDLNPLDNDTVIRLIEEIAPAVDKKSDLAAKLIQHTMGVTLHMVEILHDFVEHPPTPEALPIPPSFAKIVYQRLQSMSESQRQSLETLAVLAYPSTLREILACTGQNEQDLIHSLEYAMQYRFIQTIQDEGQLKYAFSHFLFRDVIVENMTDLRQQRLHRRIVQQLEHQALVLSANSRQEIVTRLVHHAYIADDLERLLRWTPIAAKFARDAFAYRQALTLYQHLDQLLQKTPTIALDAYATILLKMTELLRHLGDWKVQEDLLVRVLAWYDAGLIENADTQTLFLAECGTNQFRLGNYERATYYLNLAIEAAMRSENEKVLADSYNSLGNIGYYQSDWDAAEQNYLNSIHIREQIGDSVGMGKCYNNLGAVAYHRGKYALSAEYHEKNLRLREVHNDRNGVATAHNNIGAVYIPLGEWEKAKNHYLQALEIRRELDNQHGVASTLQNLGQIASIQNDFAEAFQFYEESLAIRETIEDQAGVSHVLQAMGNNYVALEQYTEAILHLKRSLAISRRLSTKLRMVETMLELSFAEAMAEGLPLSAMFYEALEIAQAIQSQHGTMRALIFYASMLSHQGLYEQAAYYVGVAQKHRNDARTDTIEGIIDELRSNMDADLLQAQMQAGAACDLETIITELLATQS